MGKPKRNKKAEIKKRRKQRKQTERIRDLKVREKRAMAVINQILSERSDTLEALAKSEEEDKSNLSSSDDQNSL